MTNYDVKMTLTIHLNYSVDANSEESAICMAKCYADADYFTCFEDEEYSNIEVIKSR